MEFLKDSFSKVFPSGSRNDTSYSYDGVVNPALRGHLESFEHRIETAEWPMRVEHFGYNTEFRRALSLASKDMRQLLIGVRRYGIIESFYRALRDGERGGQAFDQERACGFAAICWDLGQRYPIRPNGYIDFSSVGIKRLPWDEIVSETRTALGTHPLVAILHDHNYLIQLRPASPETSVSPAVQNNPNHQPKFPEAKQSTAFVPSRELTQPVQTIQRDREEEERPPVIDSTFRGTVVFQDQGLLEVEIRADEVRPARVESKFPNLQPEVLRDLERMDVKTISNLYRRLPNDPDEVNRHHHQVSYHVVRAVMFVLRAYRHELVAYDPVEDEYSLISFRRGLRVCYYYLTKHQHINNLGQLVKAVEQAVSGNPRKYWRSSFKPHPSID